MKSAKLFDSVEVQYEFKPSGVILHVEGEQKQFEVPWVVIMYVMMSALLERRVETTLRSPYEE